MAAGIQDPVLAYLQIMIL